MSQPDLCYARQRGDIYEMSTSCVRYIRRVLIVNVITEPRFLRNCYHRACKQTADILGLNNAHLALRNGAL